MPSVGIDRRSGGVLAGWAHVVQSIEDILTTRVMTRVMRRQYGSDVGKLVDAPMTGRVLLAFYVAVAEALDRWEPRFRLTSVRFAEVGADGRTVLALEGIEYPDGHLDDLTPANGSERAVSLVQLNETAWQAIH